MMPYLEFGYRGIFDRLEKMPRLRRLQGRCERSKQPLYVCRCNDCNSKYGKIPKGAKER